jgi:hypothetical protein
MTVSSSRLSHTYFETRWPSPFFRRILNYAMMRAVKASDMNELTAVNDVIFIVAVKQSNNSSGPTYITRGTLANPLTLTKDSYKVDLLAQSSLFLRK